MIVAIDGPAAAGKSTIARRVADQLGFRYLDTGALYRAVALQHLRTGARPAEVAAKLDVELGETVTVDGEDVTLAIRAPDVTRETPRIAKRPEVRAALLLKQRELMATGDWVAEGRDVGSVVVPAAEIKVFLDATAEERARRRAAETGEEYGVVLAGIKARDEHDATRPESPLICVEGAHVIDSTRLRPDDVVAEIVRLVHGAYATESAPDRLG